jgi:hypothetical protein
LKSCFGIVVHEVAEAIASQSLIIEDYPDDKYDPSCLVFGVVEVVKGDAKHEEETFTAVT